MERNYKRELDYALAKIQMLNAEEIRLRVELEEKEAIIQQLNEQLNNKSEPSN